MLANIEPASWPQPDRALARQMLHHSNHKIFRQPPRTPGCVRPMNLIALLEKSMIHTERHRFYRFPESGCASSDGIIDAAAQVRAEGKTMSVLKAQLSVRDGQYLMQAINWSRTARERGNRPFGAVVISADSALIAEAYCNTSETGDCTGHAETNAVRLASRNTGRDVLASSTLYSSGEPCVMCAGAIFWSGIRRVVFGIDAVSLRVFRGEVAEQRDAELSCRDVFAAAPHGIECIGPSMLAEASEPHVGFWNS